MESQYLENRKKLLKDAFKGKSIQWINANIIYNFFEKSLLLSEKDFTHISKFIKNTNIACPKTFIQLLTWIDYSYTSPLLMKQYYPKIISPTQQAEKRDLVKYYIHQQKNDIFVTFRGTKTFWEGVSGIKFYRVPFFLLNKNETTNFFKWRNMKIKGREFNGMRVPMLEDKEIEVHKGFLDEAQLIYADCVRNIRLVINPRQKTHIYLCGHSLGGVLAQIVGIYLAYYLQESVKKGNINIHIVSANSPPIGNKNFNLLMPYLNIKSFIRFYNYQDFIPYYGYLGSWIENKKFRHFDYMLETGISGEENTEGRMVKTKVNGMQVFVKDFGKHLAEFLNPLEKEKDVKLSLKYIYHDFFAINKKVLFI